MTRPSGWRTRKPDNAASRVRARKYASPEHRAARKTIQARLTAGHPVHCWRCGHPIPNQPRSWHVGHDDIAVNVIRGAECATCNLKAAARKGAAIVNAKRRRPSTVTRRHLLG